MTTQQSSKPQVRICTADNPWSKSEPRQPVEHPDAIEGEQYDGYPGGDLVPMKCPHCQHRWTMELPQ